MQTNVIDTFWKLETSILFQKLNSSENGITQKEADKLIDPKNISAEKKSAFNKDVKLFIGQFKSSLMFLLIIAVVISAFLGDTSDTIIISFIVLSSGLLSFIQERNAGRVIEKLQSMLSLKSTVVREGKTIEIESNKIVPGDVILLNAGDMIPADCILIEATELHLNESALTGESYPVKKFPGIIDGNTELAKRTNCLWQGTNVISGTAKAIAVHTGNNTVFGTISQSASNIVETSFEKGVKDFGYFLMKITLVLAVFILAMNLFNQKGIIESALFALALAVGMAPELLPAISTITMSAGAKRMLEKKVIVKKLASIQNLGEVDLLCTDKTGTITEGVIQVNALLDGSGSESEFVKQLAYWNAIFETGYSNPIDETLKQLYPAPTVLPEKIGEVPYDFIRKRLSIAVKTEKEILLISKGAFLQTIKICTKIKLKDDEPKDITGYLEDLQKRYDQFGLDGYRVIAICYKSIHDNFITKDSEFEMIFAGFIVLNDPIKPGIKETIAQLKSMKVDMKFITGDNKNVARSIATGLGIENPVVLNGSDLQQLNDDELRNRAQQTHIFAEVEPQQKERIIKILRRDHTVAYMGDGINDVSALSAADVGISVENAVDIARESADFVLMEKNLIVLADGIKEGRKTFANTLKYLYINTGSTFGNMCSVAAASLILPFLPMLPKQILLTNFLTDFPFLMIANDNVDNEQLDRPGKWNLKVLRNYMLVFGIHSTLFDMITFITLLIILKVQESAFQTSWFIESVLSELFILFIIRTHKNFFKSKPGKSLFVFSVLALIVTIGLPYLPFAGEIGLTPLPMMNLGAMLIIVLAYITTADFLKVWFFKKYSAE